MSLDAAAANTCLRPVLAEHAYRGASGRARAAHAAVPVGYIGREVPDRRAQRSGEMGDRGIDHDYGMQVLDGGGRRAIPQAEQAQARDVGESMEALGHGRA